MQLRAAKWKKKCIGRDMEKGLLLSHPLEVCLFSDISIYSSVQKFSKPNVRFLKRIPYRDKID
jgi:hypothetical protein